MIFAARAHAAFDLKSIGSASSVQEAFRSPLATVMLAELIATTRIFDAESPKTTSALNAMADQIAAQIELDLPFGLTRAKPLVSEVDSRAVDELQAADIAAGWSYLRRGRHGRSPHLGRDCASPVGTMAFGAVLERPHRDQRGSPTDPDRALRAAPASHLFWT